MEIIESIKSVIRSLIDVGMVLIALAIVLSILAGSNIPFLGDVVTNLIDLVNKLGSNGVVGLIVLGIILYLFQNRGAAAARK